MKQITAMMAGTVVEVLVKSGDQISKGQDVIIIESMKKQSPVHSEVTGKVREIKVRSGDFVNAGDTIAVLDDPATTEAGDINAALRSLFR